MLPFLRDSPGCSEETITIVAVLHHLTSAASDGCIRDDEALDLAQS